MSVQAAKARLRNWRENPLSFFADELKFDMGDPWQLEFIGKLPSQDPKEKQIALRACTGPGKSSCMAGAALWFIATHGGPEGNHPRGAIVSIDEANLKSTIWAELAKWQSRSDFLRSAFTWTASKFFCNEAPATRWIEARTWAKKSEKEAMGRTLGGLHAPYILAVIDEAGDIPVPILRSAQQIFSAEHRYAKILIGGNPTSLEGVLYQACVNEAAKTYSITITADPDDPKRDKRTDIDNAREQIAKYGRSNPWVMSTILGQFPPASINALLGIEDVETARRRDPRPGSPAEWR